MSEPGDPNPFGEFEAAWRRAVDRPTSVAPVEAARRAVERARLRRRRRASAWVAAAILVAAVAVWRAPVRPRPAPASPGPAAVEVAIPGPDVVVIWIDEETPLYMTVVAPEGRAPGEEGQP